jgi:alkanesulfonate monooxygenase SsuD/methylene tetrahydromethanopterin reductase-like flavin-dependent oxidoreductase (luciferase family)
VPPRRYDPPMTPDFRSQLSFQICRSYRDLLESTRLLEELGYTAMFRGDHLLPVDDSDDTITEAWMTLAGLARETKTIQLGTLVSPVTFRNPGLLARTAATVHEMSDGRAEVGMGAGWYVREHEAFGLLLPPWPERFDLLEEQLGLVRDLLTGQHVKRETAHYSIDATLGPYLGGKPPPPIVIGGEGKPRTVSLAARFADELNLDQVTEVELIRAAFVRLDAALDAIGRPRGEVVRSTVLPFPADLGEAADTIAAMQDAGVQRFYMRRTSDMPLDRVKAFAHRFLS